jgi:tRNA-dihydrouridine synthase 3
LIHALQYPRPITDAYLEELEAAKEQEERAGDGGDDVPMNASNVPPHNPTELITKRTGASDSSAQADTPDVRPRLPEKRKLSWSGKSCAILPPLHRLKISP